MTFLSKAERDEWFRSVAETNKVSQPFERILSFALTASELAALNTISLDLLLKSAGLAAPLNFDELLRKFSRGEFKIERTSGSILTINYHNFIHYTQLHQWIAQILQRFRIAEKITSLSLANFRLVYPSSLSADNEIRKYATTKVHIDAWAGEPEDILHLWVPVAGDLERNNVALYQTPPELFSEKWFSALADYDEAESLLPKTPLNISPRVGSALLFDGSCPHKTRFDAGEPRVSFDIKLCRAKYDRSKIYPSQYIAIDQFMNCFGNS